MPFYADLHVHSRYSRATSKDADLEGMAAWAKRKGIRVVGTGDFTHPAWFGELDQKLEPAEPGLHRLKPDLEREVDRRVPEACRRPVRFMLEVEISTIYKKGDRTRKVHHLVYAAEMETATSFREALGRIGNIESDGRPILGLDSRDLLEVVLESGPDAYLVPAHAWTPWFAVLGSKSGFDSVEACYGDLAEHIFAVETGLSSDPPMNWRVSGLDRYRLVSNSDAHSPPKLGREACVFDTEPDYFAMRRALETGEGYMGTVEFFPEEGKYHLDGHRKCGVRLEPEETERLDGRCPECGKPVTVGVLHRVEELADRGPDAQPEGREPFRSLVPLPEMVSEVRDVGVGTKTVRREVEGLLRRLGPELPLLQEVPMEEVEAGADPLVAEAVRRLRKGEVRREPGFDGEYGVIRLFDPGELRRQPALGGLLDQADAGSSPEPDEAEQAAHRGRGRGGEHDAAGRGGSAEADPGRRAVAGPAREEGAEEGAEEDAMARATSGRTGEVSAAQEASEGETSRRDRAETTSREARPEAASPRARRILEGLDPDQQEAVRVVEGPLLVVAGPGAGKTRTLTRRVAHLVASGRARPGECLTVTFTRRAAAELRERLEALVPDASGEVPVTTFHGLGHRLLREWGEEVGLGGGFRVADPSECSQLVEELWGLPSREAGRRVEAFGRLRRERALSLLDGDLPGVTNAPGAIDAPAPGAADAGPSAPEPPRRLEAYEAALRDRGLVDFDGLLDLPLRLLEERRETREACRRRWRYLSIDEYQDIDPLQYRLVRLLAPEGAHLCAIGDPDQSIYGFRGAEVGFFLRFRQDYPSARVVRLGRNYRSGAGIVEAARQAIAPGSLVRDRRLEAAVDAAPRKVVVHQAPTAAAEAEFVVHTIERLVGGTSYFSLDSGRVEQGEEGDPDLSFSDFAVLYRTRAQARPLVEALGRSGIPFQRRSHDRLLDRRWVRALVEELRRAADGEGGAAGVSAAGDGGPPGGDGDGGERAVVAGDGPSVRERLEAVAARLGGRSEPGLAQEGLDDALDLLAPLARRHGSDLHGFLDELALGAEVDAWDPRADRVSLLTLHAAKGLEFPVVFVVGCEDGLLPLRRGGGDVDPEEERRLLFVGMTRAERRLYLSHARRRRWRGRTRRPDPSPFLRDIRDALLERSEGGRGTSAAGAARDGTGDPGDETQLEIF